MEIQRISRPYQESLCHQSRGYVDVIVRLIQRRKQCPNTKRKTSAPENTRNTHEKKDKVTVPSGNFSPALSTSFGIDDGFLVTINCFGTPTLPIETKMKTV